ncbi:hypothetical protein Dip510_000832 [Elusimicrobium posterum]|uniref:major capsid protein n=1 Tax=Elusimicrobium posterum TaxID=3116653 RepID=UPI003C759DE0
MADVIKNNNLTWLDQARRTDPDGKTARIVELLNQEAPILGDIIMKPSNMTNGHKTTLRTGLPEVVLRALNTGTPVGKSLTQQAQFDCALVEGRSHTDKELLDMSDDPNGTRFSENDAFFEATSQKIVNLLFYGNSLINPLEHMGLSYFYSDVKKASGKNMINAGGTKVGGLSSLWLVGFNDNTIFGIYPKNTNAGVKHEDLGYHEVQDKNGNYFTAAVDKYTARTGLVVKDWRYAGRVCNIDTQALLTGTSASDAVAKLVNYAVILKNRIPSMSKAKFSWYCTGDMKTVLENQALNAKNAALGYKTIQGDTSVTTLLDIPIKKCDALLTTESQISFQ